MNKCVARYLYLPINANYIQDSKVISLIYLYMRRPLRSKTYFVINEISAK